MSTPSSDHLPLVCRITRWRAALGAPSNPGVLGHSSSCAQCRSYFETADQLEGSLRRDAGPARTLASGTLEARILNAVKHSHEPASRRQRRPSWAMAAMGVAAALAVVTVFQIQVDPTPDTRGPDASIEDVLAVANELPKQWFDAIQPNAVKLLEQNALRTEIALVSSDARSAVDFLTLNFMPSSPQSRNDPQAPSTPRQSG
jgi:hypothetical protein